MRVLLAPALALLLGTAVFAVAADDVPAPISATLEQNSNIRFGPTTSAHIVVLLKAGEEVEVFGESKSAPDWYVIRFPKQGKVWIHTKNLKALDGGARWQITEDKTRARVDSTLGADVVAELTHPCLTGTWDELAEFREARGVQLWAADVSGESIRSVSPPDRLALIVGNEGSGLSSQSRTRADRFVALPIASTVESLNVAVAAGILLYELDR